MTESDKRNVRNAALLVAEHQHKDDKDIKEIRDRIVVIKNTLQKEKAIIQNLERDLAVEAAGLSKLLMKFVPEDVRE